MRSLTTNQLYKRYDLEKGKDGYGTRGCQLNNYVTDEPLEGLSAASRLKAKVDKVLDYFFFSFKLRCYSSF